MKMVKISLVTLLLLPLLSMMAVDGHAAPVVTVSPITGNSCTVTVANVTNTMAIDVTIPYDSTALSNPVVSDGPFATAAKAQRIDNLDTPGSLRIVYLLVSGTFSGGGKLATITFTRLKASEKGVLDIAASLYDPLGAEQPTQAIVEKAGNPGFGTQLTGVDLVTNKGNSATIPSGNTSTVSSITLSGALPATDASAGSSPSSGGTQEPKRDDTTQDNRQTAAVAPALAAPDPVVAKNKEKQQPDKQPSALAAFKSVKSVLGRFQEYKGGRTIKELSSLFIRQDDSSQLLIQKPEIAVSDGSSRVMVKITLPTDTGTPSFSLRGANLKAIKTLSGGVWELEALPQKGKYDVRLSIILLGEDVEVPLTIVPPLDQKFEKEPYWSMPESAINGILAKGGEKGAKPAYDLNNDGLQDYVDDYILVAHWLLKNKPVEKDGKNNLDGKKK